MVRGGRRAGFTLLELVIVTVIIGTLGVLAIPRVAGRRRIDRVNAQARAVVALAQTARARAAGEGRTYLVVIDPVRGEARVARRRDPLAEADDEEDAERELAVADASWSRGVPFEEGVRVASAEVGGAAASATSPVTIAFRPHGEADAARVVFEAGAEDRAAITVDAAQGRCRVSAP